MSHDSRSPQSLPLSPAARALSPPLIGPATPFIPPSPSPSPPQLHDYPYPPARRTAAKVRFSGWNSIHSPASPTYSPLDAATTWAEQHISDTSSPPIPIVTPAFEHLLMDQDYPFSPPEEPYRPPHRSATKAHHHPPSHHPAHSLPAGFVPSVRPFFPQAEDSSYQKHSAYPTPPYQNHQASLQSTPYQGNSIHQPPTSPYQRNPVHQPPTSPYQRHPVHQLPTPPYPSQSTYQLPTPPYPSQSTYQQATPHYQTHSGYQQATPPYQNYPTYQQPTPQQNDLIYKQPTTPYQNYPVHRQPTNSLFLELGKEPTAQGLSHLRPLMNHSPSIESRSETPDLYRETTISNKSMEKLLQHTIIGAEFDSSDRYPPPRCHPTTRLAIIQRCKVFVVGFGGKEKLHWVVGAAGAGKSAVMQTVAEETPPDVTLGASVFFAANERQDGMKMFTTIAYQLAVKSEPYRQFILDEITRDPSLLRKSLQSQFNQFIITPFIRRNLFSSSRRFLIIIDGLDQCDDPFTQRDLLGLISHFCMTYPASPIVWIISSRPEPHITSFFNDARFAPAYTKVEIVVDSDEARQDVELYLRAAMSSIQLAYPSLKRKGEWPPEPQIHKIVTAAGGLFAYASTVVRYIGDPCYRGPGSRIRKVLAAIDADPKDDILENDYPLAQLDALYDAILSKVPDDVLVDTKKLLLLCLGSTGSFRLQGNLLGLTEDDAYTAMGHIQSLVRVPEPVNADDEPLQFFHKSFEAYLRSFGRSGFFRNIEADAQELLAQCSMRVVEEVSYGVANGEDMKYDGVSLSWPGDDLFEMGDCELRLKLYQHAIASISPANISTTILSRVPDDDMINARKLLLLRLYSDRRGDPFRMQCNLLGLTEDAAYGAIRNVSSIVRVPEPNEADDEPLKLFHKSFEDHLSEIERFGPGFSDDVRVEVEELMAQTLLRIVEEVPVDSDEMAGDEVVNIENLGYLRGCPGVCDQVSLSWPGGDCVTKMTDHELRLWLYSNAITNISCGFKAGMKAFVNMACFRVLTTRFTVFGIDFPFFQIRDFVFDKYRRELQECGVLKQVPLRGLDFAAICGPIDLRYDRPPGSESSGPWNTFCAHEKEERFMGWSTSFGRYEEDDWSEDDDAPSSNRHEVSDELDATELPRFNLHSASGNEFHWSFLGEECLWAEKQCNHCLQRLGRYFMDNPGQRATIFVDSTELCYGELSFVDPEDGGSLWTYRFFHSGSPKM